MKAALLRSVVFVCLSAGLGCALTGRVGAMMHWTDLTSRAKSHPSARFAYGPDPLQYADIWLPDSPAHSPSTPPRLFPVVLMIHGGCWQTDIADATLMNYAAEDLRRRGIAVWNIEYRGVDRKGGGYPGTFRDVAAAADALRNHAAQYHLDAHNVVAFGHSAGGHLALWLAARSKIPSDSALYSANPLAVATAISAGGLPDLKFATTPPGDTCGANAVNRLTGAPSPERPDVYRDTSPPELLPIVAQQVLVNAEDDHIAPPAFADAYAARVKAAGGTVRRVTIADEGHVELIAPGSAAWGLEVREIERALGPR